MTVMQASTPAGEARGKNVLRQALALIGQHRRAYLISNGLYYGTIIIGMIVLFFNRSIQASLMEAIGEAVSEGGPLGPLAEAYGSGRILPAVGLTFAVNLVIGCFVSISLPSLIIPFSGWLVGLYRALLWGLIFAPPLEGPFSGQTILTGVLFTVLIVLEGQGYVLALFAAYLQGRSFVFYRKAGHDSLWHGFVAGIRQTAVIYVLIVPVLIIAAMWEVLTAVVLM